MPLEGQDAKGRFAPGNKLAPGGKPGKQLWIKAQLEVILNELTTYGEGDTAEVMTRKEKILRTAVAQAEQGDRYARDFIAERTDGKVKEALPESEGEAKPIKIIDLDSEEVQAERD